MLTVSSFSVLSLYQSLDVNMMLMQRKHLPATEYSQQKKTKFPRKVQFVVLNFLLYQIKSNLKRRRVPKCDWNFSFTIKTKRYWKEILLKWKWIQSLSNRICVCTVGRRKRHQYSSNSIQFNSSRMIDSIQIYRENHFLFSIICSRYSRIISLNLI